MDEKEFQKLLDGRVSETMKFFFQHQQRETHNQRQWGVWAWQKGFWLLSLGVAVGAIAAKTA